jgi:hypothetical protein
MAEELAKTLRNYLPYSTCIADADAWEKRHAIPLIATALQAAAEAWRVEEGWKDIEDFPKDAETGSHWEVMAILDGGHRHLIVRWFGGQQGFSTLGVCGFEVTHFRIARSPFVQNQQS